MVDEYGAVSDYTLNGYIDVLISAALCNDQHHYQMVVPEVVAQNSVSPQLSSLSAHTRDLKPRQ